ncbi:MAG TPA: hypothetical protein VI039_12855 [Solirubrobacterales bacterium]
MSYRVASSHVESLHDGRMVEPGASVSDADAKKNPRLVERGVLEKEPGKRKPPAQTTTAASQAAESEPVVEQEQKEESK